MSGVKCDSGLEITFEAIEDAIGADDNLGFCLSCGAEAGGCEPDAREYECEVCGAFRVCGAQEMLFLIE